MIKNKQNFFDQVRKSLFAGKLNIDQVINMENIIDLFFVYQGTNINQLAYILATVYHETAKTMKPIREYGNNAYFFRMYDKHGDRPKVAATLGNTQPGDGVRYVGRGFVQLTGRNNYKNMGRILGLNLVDNPDLAMEPYVSAQILIEGMMRAKSTFGDFTGKALEDYINNSKTDFVNARRIVNGMDCAKIIAGYAEKFLEALED